MLRVFDLTAAGSHDLRLATVFPDDVSRHGRHRGNVFRLPAQPPPAAALWAQAMAVHRWLASSLRTRSRQGTRAHWH